MNENVDIVWVYGRKQTGENLSECSGRRKEGRPRWMEPDMLKVV